MPDPGNLLAARLATLTAECGFEIADSTVLPGHPPSFASVPNGLHPLVYGALRRMFQKGLYVHQARAIETVLAGHDVCVATPTASGKSLVFMAGAADLVQRDRSARVLAFYPAKALIQDQLGKWTTFLADVGLLPGYIDGAVPTDLRPRILDTHRIMLMTPDVAHAWMMSHLETPEVSKFLSTARLLILDEAHVYEGVFGSNMAYFLRRVQAVSNLKQVISSTATIGQPADYLEKLIGRRPQVFDNADDGSAVPDKTVFLVKGAGDKTFERTVSLIVRLTREDVCRFLAFGDSRKMVEQIVAAAMRGAVQEPEDDETSDEDSAVPNPGLSDPGTVRVLPYRAGYEEEDRQAIQRSLERGKLGGVVSTSALELGLDIGDIDLVLLLGTPPSTKAFFQRLGRAGRVNPGVCILIDDKGLIDVPGGLDRYVKRNPEPGWLYLPNRYIQYSNALCAAIEHSAKGEAYYSKTPFTTVPSDFLRFLENEINPTEVIPNELYSLKQRAQGGPHYEFPLRSGIEKSFIIKDASDRWRLGTLTLSQSLREAYPGAVYYYMARPYRVAQFKYRAGEILVKREKRYTTQPLAQNMVFPKFPGGVLFMTRSKGGFVTEAEVQVSERVVGFREQRGGNTIPHEYGPQSPYSQQPITRFFETTGVCWYFENSAFLTEALANVIMAAYCGLFEVQPRDLGIGTFHTRAFSFGAGNYNGICIYDATHGSLRLTQQLGQHFTEVIIAAIRINESREEQYDQTLALTLGRLLKEVEALSESTDMVLPQEGEALAGDWKVVIAPDEKAMLRLPTGASEEVKVKTFRFTPQGHMYELYPKQANVIWMVTERMVSPINGVTGMVRYNLITGEIKPLE